MEHQPISGTPNKRPIKVFLCHTHADKEMVRNLYARLKSDGVHPWLDAEKLLPGHDWQEEIRTALRSSDVILVCLSRNSVSKEGYVQKEIRIALEIADEKPEGTIFIIPSKLEECEVPQRLCRWQWVDLASADGYTRLLQTLDKRAASIDVAPTDGNSGSQSAFKAPLLFEAADLSEKGGFDLEGYEIYQRLGLNKYSTGIDGFLLVLIDRRLQGLAGRLKNNAYSNVEFFEFDYNPVPEDIRQEEVKQALLILVDDRLRIVYSEALGRESARLDRVFLYEDLRKPTFVLTREYSIGMGSYNGPISYLLEVSGNGVTYILPHALMSSLKKEWSIIRTGKSAEIWYKTCQPNFRSDAAFHDFLTTYERFKFNGSVWMSSSVRRIGFWESEFSGLKAEDFQKQFNARGRAGALATRVLSRLRKGRQG